MVLDPGHFAWLPDGWAVVHGLASATGLLVFAAGSQALQQRRHPSAAIAWVLLFLLLPLAGLPLYLAFGTRKVLKVRSRAASVHGRDNGAGDASAQIPQWARHLTDSLGLGAAAGFRNLRIHEDGRQAIDSLREVIDSAQRSLDVCTFILGRDRLGDDVSGRLIDRAREGVRVRLLVDGMSLFFGGRAVFGRLRRAGVEVRLFMPIWQPPFRGKANLRNHRKLVVADDRRLWSGGRNLCEEYFEGHAKRGAWRDISFDLVGPLAARAAEVFEGDWVAAGGRTSNPRSGKGAGPVDPSPDHHEGVGQLIPTGPDWPFDTVHAVLLTAFYRARERIDVVTPYLVPDESLLSSLTLAARRGVAVRVVLPSQSNHRLADLARGAALRDLLAAGARVYLHRTMVHAKLVTVDGQWALCGSANLDSRSLFLNYEVMTAFYRREDVALFDRWVEALAVRCTAAPSRPGRLLIARRVLEGLVGWLAFQL